MGVVPRAESRTSHTYLREVLTQPHALSHDFQQSYFVAGAGGHVGRFLGGALRSEPVDVEAAVDAPTTHERPLEGLRQCGASRKPALLVRSPMTRGPIPRMTWRRSEDRFFV